MRLMVYIWIVMATKELTINIIEKVITSLLKSNANFHV